MEILPTSQKGYSLEQVSLLSYFFIMEQDQEQYFGHIETSIGNPSEADVE